MAKGKRGRSKAAAAFVRGFVATGLLVGLGQAGTARPCPASRTVLRKALQGGVAIAAGSVAARALSRRRYATVLAATAAGAIGILASGALLAATPQQEKETDLGEEKE